MTSTPIGNGEVVWSPDGSTSMSVAQIGALQAANLANLMGNRERFDYDWANAAARNAQTGMTQGSRGYQRDTRAEWIFDLGGWRLALAHVELTASRQVQFNAVQYFVGAFSIDSAASTDTSLVTTPSEGTIRFVNSGVYALSSTTRLRRGDTWEPATGRTFLNLSVFPDIEDIIQRTSIAAGEDTGSLSVPNVRVPVADYGVYMHVYKTTATETTDLRAETRVRITRIG